MIILFVLDIVLSLMKNVIDVKLEVKWIYIWHGLSVFSQISLIPWQHHAKWGLMWLEVYWVFVEFMLFKRGYWWNGSRVMSMNFLIGYDTWSKSSKIRRCVSLKLTTTMREKHHMALWLDSFVSWIDCSWVKHGLFRAHHLQRVTSSWHQHHIFHGL